MNEKESRCQYKNCNEPSTVIYLENGLCDKHWFKIAEMEKEKIFKILKIK